jgi:IMP dehydrogenase
LPDPEGVSQTLQYRGSVVDVVSLYARRLRKSMSYSGAKDIESHRNSTMLDRITGSGLRESHPHSVSTGA